MIEDGETVSNMVGKGDAASSDEKTGTLELKALGAAEKDRLKTLCEASINDVKKGDMSFSVCNGRSYASVVASNRPPPASPRTRTSSEQTKTQPKPRSSSEQQKKPKFLIKLKTVNLRGQRVEEGIVRVKDYIIFGMKYNFLNFLQLITDVYELDRTGHPTDRPSKLREATIGLLTKQGFQWEEDKDNPGNILITFDGLPKKGIENEKPSWVKKIEERKKKMSC